MSNDYKAAYIRQKNAREQAEQLLEDRSRELYESNQTIVKAFQKLKLQKSQILHQEKLASIGQLSAGVAHEINNPAGYVKSNLNSLSGYIDTLFNFIRETENLVKSSPTLYEKVINFKNKNDLEYIMNDLKDLVEESIDGIERVSSIVQSLKDFARPDTEEKQPYSLNACIESTLKLVNNEIKYKAQVKTEFDIIPEIYGQSGNMSQVFLNLIVNAAQSIEKFGNIIISTKHFQNTAEIIISDTGCGIPDSIIEKIFDPFFTTKKVGEGTGLGLSIVHTIIKNQGGEINIQSEVDKGTQFTITLPL